MNTASFWPEYFKSKAFMFLLWWLVMNQMCLFLYPAVCWFRIFSMDSSRKKVMFKWRQTAVTSPVHLQGRDAGSRTPSFCNMRPKEESPTSPLCDSPGPDGLGELSLYTPKRKAAALGEGTPSLGKVKLRKLSQKNHERFIASKVNLNCKACIDHHLMVLLHCF